MFSKFEIKILKAQPSKFIIFSWIKGGQLAESMELTSLCQTYTRKIILIFFSMQKKKIFLSLYSTILKAQALKSNKSFWIGDAQFTESMELTRLWQT